MSKIWDGPTPYDAVADVYLEHPDIALNPAEMEAIYHARLKRLSYRAAMNSPEVRAMYDGLKGGGRLVNEDEAIAAYEAGLEEKAAS